MATDLERTFPRRTDREVITHPRYQLTDWRTGHLFTNTTVELTFVDTGIRMPSSIDVLAHLGYSQDFFGIKNINAVFWTLGVEVQFYLAFALLMWVADRWGASPPNPRARTQMAWLSAVLALPWLFGWLTTSR